MTQYLPGETENGGPKIAILPDDAASVAATHRPLHRGRRRLAVLARRVPVVGGAGHVHVRAMVSGLAAGAAPAAVVVAAVLPITGAAVVRLKNVWAVIGAVVGFAPALGN